MNAVTPRTISRMISANSSPATTPDISIQTSTTDEVRLGLCSWMVSSISAVVMPPSSGQLMWRTKCFVYTRMQSISRKPSSANSEKCASLRIRCSDNGPRCTLASALLTSCMTAWLRADDWAPFSSELRKINIMQAISAAVNTTRNKISHGLVLSFSIILLYRYSSINLYYSTQSA